MRTYGSGFHPHEFRVGVPRSLRKTAVLESDRAYATAHALFLAMSGNPVSMESRAQLGFRANPCASRPVLNATDSGATMVKDAIHLYFP